MPQIEQSIVDLLVEQSLATARTLVQCAEPVKAHIFLTQVAPACVIEANRTKQFVASLEKQIDQFFSDEKYVERYAGYTNEQTNPIEPFSDQGLLNLYRAKKAKEIVAAHCANKKEVAMLGIGSGDCTLEKDLLERHNNLKADVSELLKVGSKAVLKLQELFPNRVEVQGRFDVGEVSTDKKYDLVVCLEVIEHVTDPATLLANMKAVLKDDGHILVSTPNHVYWIERKLIDQFGDTNWYHHVRAYTAKTLNGDAADAGLLATIYAEPSGTLFMVCEKAKHTEKQPIEIVCESVQEIDSVLKEQAPKSVIYSNFRLSDRVLPAEYVVVNGIELKPISEKP